MTETVSLREYVEAVLADRDIRYQQRWEAQNSAIQAALLAAEKAVTKAEQATEKRFDGVNEFRQSLSDITSHQIPRAEFQAVVANLTEKVDAVAKVQTTDTGSRGGSREAFGDLRSLALLAIAAAGFLYGVLK